MVTPTGGTGGTDAPTARVLATFAPRAQASTTTAQRRARVRKGSFLEKSDGGARENGRLGKDRSRSEAAKSLERGISRFSYRVVRKSDARNYAVTRVPSSIGSPSSSAEIETPSASRMVGARSISLA